MNTLAAKTRRWPPRLPQNLTEDKLPFVLASPEEGVTREQYLAWREMHPEGGKMEYENGTVQIVELPKRVHDATAQAIVQSVRDQAVRGGWEQHYDSTGGDMFIGNNRVKQPDAAFIPTVLGRPAAIPSDPEGNPYPTVLAEVGLTETLPQMQAKVALWLSPQTTVEAVIMIKIFKHVHRTHRMLAELYQRPVPPAPPAPPVLLQSIEFGLSGPQGQAAPGMNGPNQWVFKSISLLPVYLLDSQLFLLVFRTPFRLIFG